MVKPMTLSPSARSMAATAEESTPPDMATAMVWGFGILRANRLLLIGGRQFAQPRHCLRNQCKRDINILSCVLLAQTKPDAGASAIIAQAHRRKHMGRLNRAGRTRRSRGNRQSLEVESYYHRLAINMIEITVRRVGHTPDTTAVHSCFFDLSENSPL